MTLHAGEKSLPRVSLAVVRAIVIGGAIAFCACRATAPQAPACPAGARMMGAAPPRGDELWCQKLVAGKPVKHGIFIAWGNDGRKMIQGDYADGLQAGEWTIWYENGERASVDHYRAGVQEGLHTSWYANGIKALEGNYRNGRRDGVWTSWDPAGLASHQEHYRAGVLAK